MGYEEFSTAMTNRSLRTIKAELEFLADSSVITPQQLSAILTQLPAETNATRRASQTPSTAMSQLSLNNTNGAYNDTKQANNYFDQQPTPQSQPPPAYPIPSPQPPPMAPLTTAVALYAYTATDAGDLNLQPNDRIAVTEYMNAEWWKGRNERTGHEGIFPRSYVRVEEKAMDPVPQPSSYGNMPHDVAQQPVMAGPVDNKHSKLQDGGKKFGKKLGNAAIFGAGATIGSQIVSGIF